MKFPFQVKYSVAFRDIDMHGVLHHSNYYYYCEKARIELLDASGLSYISVMDMGLGLVLVESRLKYFAPVKFNDLLELNLGVDELGRTSFKILYSIEVAGKKVSEGYTHHVCINLNSGKPVKLSPQLIEAMGRYPLEK